MPIFSVRDGLKCRRIILGNPVLAITMLEHNLTAGLAVPVELLLLKKKEGVVDLIYQLPSAFIAGLNRDQGFVNALAELDRNLESLVRDVASCKTWLQGPREQKI